MKNNLRSRTMLANLLLCLSLCLATPQAHALKSDRDQPADIDADETEFDFRTGTRTFIGNVIVIQGTLRIKADKMVAVYADGKIKEATAWGSLARFKSRPDGKEDDVEGWGKKIYLNNENNTLTLLKRAKLKQGLNTANGEEIVYNMATDKLKVKGGTRLSGNRKGEARPDRKLEDPFKEDKPAKQMKSKDGKKGKNAKKGKNGKNGKQSDDTTEQVFNEQTAPPVPVGRSRLIIQPKPKPKSEDDESEEDGKGGKKKGKKGEKSDEEIENENNQGFLKNFFKKRKGNQASDEETSESDEETSESDEE